MKILLVCMGYDYGDPSRGRSYEYFNFYDSLRRHHEVELFDFMERQHSHGQLDMNRQLIEAAASGSYDVAVFSLYTDQILTETVDRVRRYTKTLCFFHDDTWRREFVQLWAPRFDWFTSSDFECQNRYGKLGLDNVVHFPFGANLDLYKPIEATKRHDVSFVGSWHPQREWLISRLRKAGIDVVVRGHGWPSGKVSHDEMIELFSASRINLNLSNSKAWDVRLCAAMPVNFARQLRSPKIGEQIKARQFEINACRAFQISYYVDGLERCYRIGEEIAIYLDPDDLLAKVKYYLSDGPLRDSIANAGYARTMKDHTFEQRFARVFAAMGLQVV